MARAARDTLARRGDAISTLEARLRSDFAADEAVLCDSGTSALRLAIRCADRLLPGPNVVALPAFTCFEVAAAAIGADAHLTLYDVDPNTLAPDLASLERALREGAKTVVVTPLFGIPIDWPLIREITEGHGATAIEDAAQGHGGRSVEGRLGSHGRLSVISFGRGKGWSGFGGGVLLGRSVTPPGKGRPKRPDLDPGSLSAGWKSIGAALGQWVVGHPQTYALPASIPWLGLGETRFRLHATPTPMTRASARLILDTADAAAAEVPRRRAHAAWYARQLPETTSIFPICPPAADDEPGFLRYPLRLRGGIAGFRSPAQARRLGIESGYPSTLAALGPVRARLWRRGHRWSGAEALARELVTLPTHSRMTAEDLRAVVDLITEYAGARK